MSQRVAVLGGGISGLAAAWNLARRRPNFEVLLLEHSERLGGWMRSHRTEEGAVFELGPRSLRTAGVAGKTTLAIVRRSTSNLIPIGFPSLRRKTVCYMLLFLSPVPRPIFAG